MIKEGTSKRADTEGPVRKKGEKLENIPLLPLSNNNKIKKQRSVF